MHDDAAEPFAVVVPDNDRFKSFHVVDPLKGGLSRGAACIEVGRVLFPGWTWFWSLPGLTALTNALYWVLVKAKPVTGRLVADADGPWELP